ncbi:MAG: hypothetical protein HY274_03250 [Gammaproteobacteria bacterium]|nr:hypothetical protein [Gammaproteobacteria bacterium]
MHCHRVWLLLVMMALALTTASGCNPETRYRVLSKIFEEVPPPGKEVQHKPVVHGPRRSPAHEPVKAPEKVDTVLASPEWVTPRNWRELLRQLPKEEAGGVDWDDALAKKLIQPRSGLEPDAPDQPAFDLNLELIPEGQPFFKVVFPHKEHTEWLACANCHTDIFKMQRGADPITMTKIYSGEYCGRCHGKVSFTLPTGCPRCHAALAGPAKTK